MDQMIEYGRYSMEAMIQHTAPANSGPGWMSILHGVEPIKHHVFDNSDYLGTQNEKYPSFLKVAHDEYDLRTVVSAVMYDSMADNFIEPGSTDEKFIIKPGKKGGDDEVTDYMVDSLQDKNFDLAFLLLDGPDDTGHNSGFSATNEEYLETLRNTDTRIKKVLQAIDSRSTRGEEEWLFAITTDHGGFDTGHTAFDQANRHIFLIFSGDGLEASKI